MCQKPIQVAPCIFLISLAAVRLHVKCLCWIMLIAGFACAAGLCSSVKQTTAQQPAKTGESPSGQASGDQDASAIQADVALVQAALTRAKGPDSHSLSEALGIDISRAKGDSIDWETNGLKDLGDLDGDGVSEFALNRLPAASHGAPNETIEEQAASWELFLLAWDGAAWRASLLKAGFEPYELRVVSSPRAETVQLALILYAGATAVPYPAIYQFKEHVASLLWDGHADESQYEGYAQGKIEFLQLSAGGDPEMIASGHADPGVIRFSRDGKRGFDVQALYDWDGKAYVPKKTEYTPNQDYQLYQFISALHLHNFRAAYALIDPAKFLKTDSPSLKIFQQRIESDFAEFLDDEIFEAVNSAPTSTDDFNFEVQREGKTFVYRPQFSPGPEHLITTLDRRDQTIHED
jgi:hypothetical protein